MSVKDLLKKYPKILKVSDIAEITTLDAAIIRKVIRQGVLKAFRPAGTEKWLIKVEDFEDWFLPKEVPSSPSIKEEKENEIEI